MVVYAIKSIVLEDEISSANVGDEIVARRQAMAMKVVVS